MFLRSPDQFETFKRRRDAQSSDCSSLPFYRAQAQQLQLSAVNQLHSSILSLSLTLFSLNSPDVRLWSQVTLKAARGDLEHRRERWWFIMSVACTGNTFYFHLEEELHSNTGHLAEWSGAKGEKEGSIFLFSSAYEHRQTVPLVVVSCRVVQVVNLSTRKLLLLCEILIGTTCLNDRCSQSLHKEEIQKECARRWLGKE